ncbi:MAG: hypothetical protein FWG40_12605 [Peptococcaceae bacterium]|nr:hypothetical protein [Peptococcaceae bacterium]
MALIYLGLDNDADITHFLQRLADCDGLYAVQQANGTHTKYTSWHYDEKIMTNLQKYVDLHREALLVEYSVVRKMTDDELETLFRGANPGSDASPEALKEFKRAYLQDLNSERMAMEQKRSLLIVTGNLGKAGDHKQQDDGKGFIDKYIFRKETIIYDNLNGREKSTVPDLIVKANDDGSFDLTYGHLVKESDMTSHPVQVDPWHPATIKVGKTIFSIDALIPLEETKKAYISQHYQYDISDVEQKGEAYLVKKVRSKFISYAAKELEEEALGKGAKFAARGLPYLTDGLFLVDDMYADYQKNISNVRVGLDEMKNLMVADFCFKFDLDSNLISMENPEENYIIYCPGPSTENILRDINTELAKKTSLVITVEDIYNDPIGVMEKVRTIDETIRHEIIRQ